MIRAKASTTEEPDAGKLHVRVCGGGARQRAFLLRDVARIVYVEMSFQIVLPTASIIPVS